MHDVGSAAESLTRVTRGVGTHNADASGEEYRLYLAKVAEGDEDVGVRRIAARLLKELFGEDGMVVKSSGRAGYLTYLARMSREHPDPAWRERAERVVEGRVV